ncbi:transposase [Cucumis melo var. makuwa]|uniref:Transposase n=1 Tax=Cucumis melo var. makuwa TaxID=1194695 RepID=A0A5D3DHL6_CUCMM|nr:transposase [Cucumis melo var. makuwa]
MIEVAHEEYSKDPNGFEKLLIDAEKPLYEGCKKYTKLSTLVKLYNLKVRYGWSDINFSELLKTLKEILPTTNELPNSLYEAKKTLGALGMEYEKIHACPNNCCLYRKEFANATECLECGQSRWRNVKDRNEERKQIPSKVIWYFPPIPQFKRLFRNIEYAENLTWHASERIEDGKLRHPADSPAWKLVDFKWPDFGSESRNLRLALSADGVNPHGSKQPGDDIGTYLAPLIEDLKLLWENGVECYDAYREEVFNLRSVLLWTINDFPAYGNLSGCCVKGYKACPICGDNTNSIRVDPVGLGTRKSQDHLDTSNIGRPLSMGVPFKLEQELLRQAHRYVLENTIDVQPYMDAYAINGCRYHTKSSEKDRSEQNSGVNLVAKTMQVPSSKDKNLVIGDMSFYGVIQEIWELNYNTFNVPVFKCDWVQNSGGVRIDELGYTLVDLNRVGHKSNSFILASQPKQVFYVDDPSDVRWSVILTPPQRDFEDRYNDDELGDTILRCEGIPNDMPDVDLNNDLDENVSMYVRSDCEGTWIPT